MSKFQCSTHEVDDAILYVGIEGGKAKVIISPMHCCDLHYQPNDIEGNMNADMADKIGDAFKRAANALRAKKAK